MSIYFVIKCSSYNIWIDIDYSGASDENNEEEPLAATRKDSPTTIAALSISVPAINDHYNDSISPSLVYIYIYHMIYDVFLCEFANIFIYIYIYIMIYTFAFRYFN